MAEKARNDLDRAPGPEQATLVDDCTDALLPQQKPQIQGEFMRYNGGVRQSTNPLEGLTMEWVPADV